MTEELYRPINKTELDVIVKNIKITLEKLRSKIKQNLCDPFNIKSLKIPLTSTKSYRIT